MPEQQELMDEHFATTTFSPELDRVARNLSAIQHKVAVSALPASALRGQRTPGLTKIARDVFRELPLGQFGVANAKLFLSRLDACTDGLIAKFPRGARRWGVARKALNLFLRDAFYNQFLAAKYNLNRAAAHYELVLDSYTAKALDQHDYAWDLPAWRGLGKLTPAQSAEYQSAAHEMAEEYGCTRVDLDAHIWAAKR